MPKQLMTVAQMQDREAWLKARELGIGGSDAGIICGLSRWKSPFQLWLEKTHQVEPDDLSNNEYVYWGNVLEEVVAQEFCRRTGKKVQRKGLMQSDEYPFMLASVDRVVVGENAILECKTANGFAAKEWQDDEIPDSYYCQLQHYLAVGGYDKAYIAVLIGGNHYLYKEVARNEADIEALILAEKEFWDKVQTGTMPDVDGTDSCAAALRDKFSGGNTDPIELSEKEDVMLAKYFELKEIADGVKQQMDEIKNQLCQTLGDNEVGLASEHKVSWRTQAGRKTLDSKALQKDHPDIYEKYLKVGKPTRVFKIN